MPTSSRLTTNPGGGPLRVSTTTITLTDTDGVARTIIVGTIRFLSRNYDGGTFVTFMDRSQVLFREEPDEVSRLMDEADGVPGTMPTHKHGRTIPAHRLGWRE